MSYAELQERLNVVKKRQEEDRKVKHGIILEEKNAKRNAILKKSQKLAEIRLIAKRESAERHQKLKEIAVEEKIKEQAIKDQAVVEVS
jgi:hypothetical protein